MSLLIKKKKKLELKFMHTPTNVEIEHDEDISRPLST
jgi:hypothetical protein